MPNASMENEDTTSGKPKESVRKRKRAWWRPRFRLIDMFWFSIVSAILILWYQDHQALSNKLLPRNTQSSWSFRQVLGKPNTPVAGDQVTAWASQSQDSGMEWLVVEFPRRVLASKIQIEETYNPGAVNRICSLDWQGSETELWKGVDPTPQGSGKGTSVIAFDNPITTRRVKIYLDSARVRGWNEIDAVALIDKTNSKQWATDAWASSCFGENQELPKWFWP